MSVDTAISINNKRKLSRFFVKIVFFCTDISIERSSTRITSTAEVPQKKRQEEEDKMSHNEDNKIADVIERNRY